MIKIVAAGKIKDSNLKALCDDYQKRISRYSKIEVIEVRDENLETGDEDKIKKSEGERILKQVKSDDYVILLDLRGSELDSVAFANKLQGLIDSSRNITFIIGGSIGVSDDVLNRADYLLKLGKMTFLHQMSRLIILEQIYRGFKIMHHETYHK
ncbi:MAG: 23S rRNA (pseudouridine(1915)-N(3))-methyltransferase RlmH [Erysipelotrichaceae bacterium]|nr:23S rRNA (pseudouridine(1915)-N(3))-methyltransferase RlmH [Erysipelotrichaceae bacterium]